MRPLIVNDAPWTVSIRSSPYDSVARDARGPTEQFTSAPAEFPTLLRQNRLRRPGQHTDPVVSKNRTIESTTGPGVTVLSSGGTVTNWWSRGSRDHGAPANVPSQSPVNVVYKRLQRSRVVCMSLFVTAASTKGYELSRCHIRTYETGGGGIRFPPPLVLVTFG